MSMHVDVIMDFTILLAIIGPHIKILWSHIKFPIDAYRVSPAPDSYFPIRRTLAVGFG